MPDAPPLVLTIDGKAAQVGARDFESAVKRIQNAGGKTEQAVNKVGGSFQKLKSEASSLRGTLATLGASIGLGVIISASVRKFSELEKGLVGVAKTANLSNQEIVQLRDRIASISQVVPETTESLLSIAQAAGQLGVTGVSNIALFTETIGKLGGASDIAGEEAATALARILNVTRTPIESVDRLASAIVALGNNFAATESEITHVTQRLAQETSAFKTSAADVAGLGAALKSFGVQAERGGGVVGRVFGKINTTIGSSGEAVQLFSKLTGKSIEDLRKSFETDSFSVFRDLLKGLHDANLSSQDFSKTLNALGVSAQEDFSVISVLVKNIDLMDRAVRIANEGFDQNVALNQEAARAAATFSSQMTFLHNSVDSAAAVLGGTLVPALLEVSKNVREFLVNARDSGELERIFKNVGSAASFLADNSREVAAAFAAIAGTRLGAVFGPWGALVGGLAAGFGVLATRTDEAKAAQDRFNIIIDKGNKVLQESVTLSGERAKALEAEKRNLISLAEAEIANVRTQLQARKLLETPSKPTTPGYPSNITGVPNTPGYQANIDKSPYSTITKDLEKTLAGMERRLQDLKSGSNLGGETARLAQILGGAASTFKEATVTPPRTDLKVSTDKEKRIAKQNAADELRDLSKLTAREKRQREIREESRQSVIRLSEANAQLGRTIEQDVLTPYERYEKEVAKVNELQKAGYISSDTAAKKLKQLSNQYVETAKRTDLLARSILAVGDVTTSAFEDMIFRGESFKDTIANIIKQLAILAFRTASLNLFNELAGAVIPTAPGGAPTAQAGSAQAIPAISSAITSAVASRGTTPGSTTGVAGAPTIVQGGSAYSAGVQAVPGGATNAGISPTGAVGAGAGGYAAFGPWGLIPLAAETFGPEIDRRLQKFGIFGSLLSLGITGHHGLQSFASRYLFAEGGKVDISNGGLLQGPGTGTSDSIPVLASNGEYIVNAEATKKYYPLLDALNKTRKKGYARGGVIGFSTYDAMAGGVNNNYSSSNPVVVNNNVTVDNSGVVNDTEGNTRLAKVISRELERSMQGIALATIAKESRSKGILNQGAVLK